MEISAGSSAIESMTVDPAMGPSALKLWVSSQKAVTDKKKTLEVSAKARVLQELWVGVKLESSSPCSTAYAQGYTVFLRKLFPSPLKIKQHKTKS